MTGDKILFCKTKADLTKAYNLLKDADWLQVDSETSSLDPHTMKVWSVQFGFQDTLVLVPFHHLKTLGGLEKLLMTKSCIAHNAKFDLQVLWSIGYDMPYLMDTLVLEQLIKAGFLHYHAPGIASMKLGAVLNRHLGVTISKEERTHFYDGTFEAEVKKKGLKAWTQELIDYSLNDIKYLGELLQSQKERLQRENLMKTVKLEMDVLPITAKMEYLGVLGDYKGMEDFQIKMEYRRDEIKPQLIVQLENFWQKYWRREYARNSALYDSWDNEHQRIMATNKERDPDNARKLSAASRSVRDKHLQLKPFPTRPKPKGELRLSAPQQVRHALEESGIVLSSMRKEVLEDAAGLNPVLDLYLEYKKYEKLAQMLESVSSKVNPVTNRIHSTFNQVINTGRYSSSKPNLLNIPSRTEEGKEFRKRAVIAPKGRKLLIADFSAIELAIIAKLSNDAILLDALNSGKDLHCFSMSKVFGCSYDAVIAGKKVKSDDNLDILSLTELKDARKFFDKTVEIPDVVKTQGYSQWINQLRDPYFKTITYGTVYGLTPFNFARKFHCSMDSAEIFFNLFYDVYPAVRPYIEKIGNQGLELGWNATIGGRKRYYSRLRPPSLDDAEEMVLQKLKEDDRILDSVTDDEWYGLVNQAKKSLFREFKRKEGRVKREAGNMPIQGTNADITKRSMVLFENYIAEENFAEDEGVILQVYDELICEVTTKHAKRGAELLKKAMTEAAHEFLGDNILIEVKPLISQFWTKG